MPALQSARRLAGGFALAFTSVLTTLLVCEAGLALFDYPPRLTEDQRLFVEYDSVRGWRNVRGSGGRLVTSEYDVALDYNEHGYRGPLHAYPKPAGTYRVLLLGDSFLEGYTVALEHRVAEVAQASLAGLHPPGGVEMVALGTAGYSTDQELLWLEAEGLRYAPDLVILILVDNDYWYNNRDTYPRGPKPLFRAAGDSLVLTHVPVPRLTPPDSAAPGAQPAAIRLKAFLARHSRLYRLARRAIERSPAIRAVGARLGLMDAPADRVQSKTSVGPMPEEFAVFAEPLPPAADSAVRLTGMLLARMDRETRAAGGSLVVMHVPTNQAVYPPGAPQSTRYERPAPFGDPSRASALFARVCQEAGVTCVDPTDRFIAEAGSLAARGRLLIFPQDEHWNEEGHRLAGEVVAGLVRSAMEGGRPRQAPPGPRGR